MHSPAVTDPVLGVPYLCETIGFPPDEEGAVVATLVKHGATNRSRRAVLQVHGFCDYFFQTEAADFWVERGYDFYAVDLRKYGRSIRPHQTVNYAADLAEYYGDLDAVWERITVRDGHDHVVLSAHSTGGLTSSLWAHDRRPAQLAGVFLNAPWLTWHGTWTFRNLVTRMMKLQGSRNPRKLAPRDVTGLFTKSLHSDFDGEWTFNLAWKPVYSHQAYFGWLRAVTLGHDRIGAGLDIPAPILVLSSAHSFKPTAWSPEVDGSDIVLDVRLMKEQAALLGRRVTINQIPGALHDVTLSRPEVRAEVFRQIATWCEAQVEPSVPLYSRDGQAATHGETSPTEVP